jgi:uncharacterized protein YfcZ (UPF0381/DUF406 family)
MNLSEECGMDESLVESTDMMYASDQTSQIHIMYDVTKAVEWRAAEVIDRAKNREEQRRNIKMQVHSYRNGCRMNQVAAP